MHEDTRVDCVCVEKNFAARARGVESAARTTRRTPERGAGFSWFTSSPMSSTNDVLAEYLDAFAGERAAERLLTYHEVAPDKTIRSSAYTRGEFLQLALKAAHVLAAQCRTRSVPRASSLRTASAIWHSIGIRDARNDSCDN